MDRRKHIDYGYKAFTGQVLSNYAVDAYNRIQDRINSYIDAGFDVPESLLNESHHAFATYAGNLD